MLSAALSEAVSPMRCAAASRLYARLYFIEMSRCRHADLPRQLIDDMPLTPMPSLRLSPRRRHCHDLPRYFCHARRRCAILDFAATPRRALLLSLLPYYAMLPFSPARHAPCYLRLRHTFRFVAASAPYARFIFPRRHALFLIALIRVTLPCC